MLKASGNKNQYFNRELEENVDVLRIRQSSALLKKIGMGELVLEIQPSNDIFKNEKISN